MLKYFIKIKIGKAMLWYKLIIGLMFLFPITAVNSADAIKEAESWIKIKGEETLKAFAEEDKVIRLQKIDQLILENFDLEGIGRFALGRYWRFMSPELQNYYLRVFNRYTLANYKSMPLIVSPDAQILTISANKAEDDSDTINVNTTVATKLTPDNPESTISLDFRLKKINDKFKIFDIKLAEVSSLLVYRDQFSQMIRERNNDLLWFIEDLDFMAEDLENETIKTCPNCKF